MSYSYGDLASPDLHDVAMDDSDDDLMGPSVDSVTMDDLQFFINELEAPRTSHLKDKPHDNTNSQARDRVHHSQSQNQSHQPAPLANITTDRHQTVPERPIRSSQVLCTICFNYKIVAKCYGIIICAACKIFIYKVSRSEKQVTCDTGHYDCRILYTDTKRCQACRLKKAYSVGMKHPSLPADFDRYREIFPDPSQDVSQARHLDASTSHASQQTIEPSLQADNSVLQDEPSYTTNHSPSKQRVMVCDVCGVEDAIRKIQRYYNINSCAACGSFIYYYATKGIYSYKCVTGRYDCDISRAGHSPGKPICRGCRLRRVAELQPSDMGFPVPGSEAHEQGSTSSHQNTPQTTATSSVSPKKQASQAPLPSNSDHLFERSSKDNCCICENPNYVQFRSLLGILCCKNCFEFLLRTAEKEKSFKCHGRGDCAVEWRPNMRKTEIMCPACRWKKATQQPNFKRRTLSNIAPIPVEPTDSQKTATSSVSPKKQASQAPLPPSSDHSFEGSSKDNCCICNNPNWIQFRSFLGLRCCMNCSGFLSRAVKKKKSFKCRGRGNCTIEWRPNIPKGEICNACRWKKATQQPNFKHHTLSNIVLKPAEPTDSQKTATSSVSPKKQASQAPLPPSSDHSFEGSSKDNCCICNNPNFIQFRSFLGLRCCMNCSGFLSRAVKKKKSFKCRGRGNCTIEWRPNIPKGEICNACRWKKATQQPNFKHRTLSNIVPKPAEPTDSPRLVSKRLDVSRIASNSTKKGCAVCAATRPRIQCVFVPRQYGIAMCTNCYSFTQRCYRTKRILKCPEQGRCTIQGKDAGDICSACRWKAIIENPDFLGRRLWKGHSEKGPTDGIVASQPANDSCRTSHSTIEPTDQHLDSSPETTEELDSHHTKSLRGTISDLSSVTSFDSNSDSNSESSSESSSEYSSDSSSDSSSSPDSSADSSSHTIISTNPTHDSDIEDEETIAGPDDEIPVQPEARPAAEIRIMTANELDGEVDEFGLPLKIEERFSRWLYGDLSCFLPGSSRSKKRKHEVKPGVARRLVTFSNKLDGHFTYLTSDIDVETCLQPVGELFTPVLEIRPSVSLLKAHALSTNGTQDGDCNSEKKTKPLLTFILESRRTIVDRRPMLERRKAAKKPSEEKNQESELSASLIGPGEDCDAADPIIEIDCDI